MAKSILLKKHTKELEQDNMSWETRVGQTQNTEWECCRVEKIEESGCLEKEGKVS